MNVVIIWQIIMILKIEIIKYMSYKLLIFIAIVTLTAQQYTDITMLNCPAQFDVSKYNTTTDSTVANMGSFIYAGFSS